MCERELETATYWPHQLFWLSQPLFPVLLGCSIGGLVAQPLLVHGSHSSIFSPTDLNFLSPGLCDTLTSTYFLRASHLYSIQPVDSQGYLSADPLISPTGCTCYLHRCISSFDSLAGVNMQHWHNETITFIVWRYYMKDFTTEIQRKFQRKGIVNDQELL